MITYSSALSLSHIRLPLSQEWLKVLEKLFLMKNGRLKHYPSKTVIVVEDRGKKNCRNGLIPCLESTKSSSLIQFKVYIRHSKVMLSISSGWLGDAAAFWKPALVYVIYVCYFVNFWQCQSNATQQNLKLGCWSLSSHPRGL